MLMPIAVSVDLIGIIDGMAHAGEVGIEIAPVLDATGEEGGVAEHVDDVLRRTCAIARALTGAEQAALKLWVDSDPSQARKYFSLSDSTRSTASSGSTRAGSACTACRLLPAK